MSNQFVRRCELLLISTTGKALDLSAFRIKFTVEAMDTEHPNSAAIRVYNLDPGTVNKIQHEFQYVTLNAGYVNGAYGTIFVGTLKQFRFGKEDPVTTFLDLLAADTDIQVNNSFIAATLAAGHTAVDVFAACQDAMNKAGKAANPTAPPLVTNPQNTNPSSKLYIPHLSGGAQINPRGKVLYGYPKNYIGSTAARLQCTWSIQNGQMQFIPYSGFLAGETIELSQLTGVIGIPEITNEGIKIKALINPGFKVGATVRLNDRLLNQVINAAGNANAYNSYKEIPLYATVGRDNLYRIYVVEWEGDTRGQPWYADLICLAVDGTSQQVIINPTSGAAA